LVNELDNELATSIYANNSGMEGVYTADNLVNYDLATYKNNKLHLLAIEKIGVNAIAACDEAFKNSLTDGPKRAKRARNIVRIFSWILLTTTCLTVFFGLVFILAALFKFVASQNNTKVKVARVYWFSSWFIVVLAILTFIIYNVYFTIYVKNNEATLVALKAADCFPGNPGINLAI